MGGAVGSLRLVRSSDNTRTPSSSQVILKINWFDEDVGKFRNYFVLRAAFPADYTPRVVTGNACNLRIGDIVSGVHPRPVSEWNSACIDACDFGSIAEFQSLFSYPILGMGFYFLFPGFGHFVDFIAV